MLPEAYEEEQLPAFHETAARIADGLFNQKDFASYTDRINVWYLDVRSEEDQLDGTGLFGERHDTAFDGKWGGGGIVGLGDAPDNCTTYGDGAVARGLAEATDMDVVVMIANADGIRGLYADEMINIGRDTSGVVS